MQIGPSLGQPNRARHLVTNASVLYARMFLVLAISLYTSRVILRELGMVDYGIYGVVAGFIALVGFVSSALTHTTQRFLAFEHGRIDGDVPGVFSTAIAIHLVAALLLYLVIALCGRIAVDRVLVFPEDRTAAVVATLYMSTACFCLSIVQAPFVAAVLAQERMHLFAMVSVAESILKLGVALSLPFAKLDRLVHYALLVLLVAALVLATYVFAQLRTVLRIFASPNFKQDVAKSMAAQAGWNLWGNIAATIGTQGANILLNVFFGPVANAARSIAYQVNGAAGMFINNVQTAINPQLIKSYAAADRAYFQKLVMGGSKLYALIFLALAAPLIIETEYILTIWLGTYPPYAPTFTRLVLITLFPSAVSGPLMTAVQASGNVRRYNLVLGSISLLNIPMSWAALSMGAPPESVLYVAVLLSALMLPIRLMLASRICALSMKAYCAAVLRPVAVVAGLLFSVSYLPSLLIPASLGRFALTLTCLLLTLGATIALGISLSVEERAWLVEAGRALFKRRTNGR